MVAIVGLGRLGRTMATLLERSGHDVVRVGRGDRPPADRVVWLCVRDGDIPDAARQLPDGAIALHASGALPASVLPERLRGGVLHPLMTFSGDPRVNVDLRGVPARLAGHPDAVRAGGELAEILGLRALPLEDGASWHAAACLVSGHLGELVLTAASVLTELGMSEAEARQTLAPLATASLRNVLACGAPALTGPALRGDSATEELHRRRLAPEARGVYDILADGLRRRRQSD